MTRTILALTVLLVACDGAPSDPDSGELPERDAGLDAGGEPDSGGDIDAGPPDAGACEIDCPELPEGCFYDGQDCEAEVCGDPICPEPDQPCGGLFNPVCPSTHYCDYTEPGACGLLDETGICQPIPTECSTECEEVCGCDGATYCNECEAHAAGREVASAGACAPPDPCRPWDAFGIGDCGTSVGWAWNGSECVELIGCSCDGTDCFRVEGTQEACEAPFGGCGSGT